MLESEAADMECDSETDESDTESTQSVDKKSRTARCSLPARL